MFVGSRSRTNIRNMENNSSCGGGGLSIILEESESTDPTGWPLSVSVRDQILYFHVSGFFFHDSKLFWGIIAKFSCSIMIVSLTHNNLSRFGMVIL